jgi:hypothetical protein
LRQELCSWGIIVSGAQPLVTNVIIGAKSMHQLRDNIGSARVHLMSPKTDSSFNEPNGPRGAQMGAKDNHAKIEIG